MKVMKAYKFRLYPNIEQKKLINKIIGCTRFIYNYMLEKKIKNNKLSRFDLNNLIPSVCVCEEYELTPKKEQIVVGIDIGVKSLVVTSNGETFGNPNIIKNMKRE